jgi:hypothetical protein
MNMEAQLKLYRKKRTRVWRLIKKLDSIHPEYKDEWVDHFNAGREEKGIPRMEFRNDQFKEFDEFEFENPESYTIAELTAELSKAK